MLLEQLKVALCDGTHSGSLTLLYSLERFQIVGTSLVECGKT